MEVRAASCLASLQFTQAGGCALGRCYPGTSASTHPSTHPCFFPPTCCSGYRNGPLDFPPGGLLMDAAERYEVICDFSSVAGQTLFWWNGRNEDYMKVGPAGRLFAGPNFLPLRSRQLRAASLAHPLTLRLEGDLSNPLLMNPPLSLYPPAGRALLLLLPPAGPH
jgi:hypothetical protein